MNRDGWECPCGSGALLRACCGRYLACVAQDRVPAAEATVHDAAVAAAVLGAGAPTAEALMRSRYTAFVLRDAAYLLATWATSTRPENLSTSATTIWKRLLIQDTVAGGPEEARGEVAFTAAYTDGGGRGRQQERSRFERADGRWVYVDGDVLD